MHKICFTISFISCLYMFRAHVLIIRRSKLHYKASGIITPIGVDTRGCVILYFTVLYCTVLYCTVLYCTALHCTVLYCTVLLWVVWNSIASSDTNQTWKHSKEFCILCHKLHFFHVRYICDNAWQYVTEMVYIAWHSEALLTYNYSRFGYKFFPSPLNSGILKLKRIFRHL